MQIKTTNLVSGQGASGSQTMMLLTSEIVVWGPAADVAKNVTQSQVANEKQIMRMGDQRVPASVVCVRTV